jgi:signal peptidase II
MPTSSNRSWLPTMAYGLAALVILVDQIAKYWILNGLHMGPGASLQVTSFFHLTLVMNRGVSFGLFQSQEGQEWMRWILAAFAGAVAIALAIWVRSAQRRLPAMGIGLIIGGALGNLADRIRFGSVVDFLDFGPLFPWVFNVADAAVNVGVALLLIDTFLGRDKKSAQANSPI